MRSSNNMELDKILSQGLSSWNIDITENQQNNFKIYKSVKLGGK